MGLLGLPLDEPHPRLALVLDGVGCLVRRRVLREIAEIALGQRDNLVVSHITTSGDDQAARPVIPLPEIDRETMVSSVPAIERPIAWSPQTTSSMTSWTSSSGESCVARISSKMTRRSLSSSVGSTTELRTISARTSYPAVKCDDGDLNQ